MNYINGYTLETVHIPVAAIFTPMMEENVILLLALDFGRSSRTINYAFFLTGGYGNAGERPERLQGFEKTIRH